MKAENCTAGVLFITLPKVSKRASIRFQNAVRHRCDVDHRSDA